MIMHASRFSLKCTKTHNMELGTFKAIKAQFVASLHNTPCLPVHTSLFITQCLTPLPLSAIRFEQKPSGCITRETPVIESAKSKFNS